MVYLYNQYLVVNNVLQNKGVFIIYVWGGVRSNQGGGTNKFEGGQGGGVMKV